jgi:hypothetical protein
MKNQTSSARASLSPVFLQILKENHQKVLNLDARLEKLKKDLIQGSGEDYTIAIEGKIQSLEDELSKSVAIVITFSVMVLESYIYDYAARHLTDTFVKDHLDKLDTFSKWVIIPSLITGREIPQQSNWRGLLKKAIKARNSIIHYKSSQPPTLFHNKKQYIEKLQEDSDALLETSKQSIQLLKILADKIIEIDPQESAWVKAHLT